MFYNWNFNIEIMDKELSKDAKNASSANLTAVEWLIEQMFKQGYFDGNKPLIYTNLDHLQNQAKEMEKEQHEKFNKFLNDEKQLGISDLKTTERIQWYYNTYFNETYEGKNE